MMFVLSIDSVAKTNEIRYLFSVNFSQVLTQRIFLYILTKMSIRFYYKGKQVQLCAGILIENGWMVSIISVDNFFKRGD